MNDLTPDEMIEYLKNTFTPTILVEGTGDVKIYRWIESYLGERGYDVSVMQTGGRTEIFKVHLHKSELPEVPIVFTADLDGYMFQGVPLEYDDVVFTSGYSIENDVVDENYFIALMNSREESHYTEIKRLVSEWFAQEADELRRSGSWRVGRSIHAVINCKSRIHVSPVVFDHDLADFVYDNFLKVVRGKNVIDSLVHILSDKSRGDDRYNSGNVIGLSLNHGNKEAIKDLAERIRVVLETKYQEYGWTG